MKMPPPLHVDRIEALEAYRSGLHVLHGDLLRTRRLIAGRLARLVDAPAVRAEMQRQLGETSAQIERGERLLAELGDSPTALEDDGEPASAIMTGILSAMADEEIVANRFGAFLLANFKAAAYETLILLAEAAGRDAVVPILLLSLGEERDTACFLAVRMHVTGLRLLDRGAAQGGAIHRNEVICVPLEPWGAARPITGSVGSTTANRGRSAAH